MSSFYPSCSPPMATAAAAASSGQSVDFSSYAILHLNVGGTRFSTSRQTLLSAGENNFFSAMLSGRIGCLRDESGAIFIDRDPDLFRPILNYLRTRTLSLSGVEDTKALLHEAEYYGVASLVKQLTLCGDLEQSGCGDVLFYTYLSPPLIPSHEHQHQRRPIRNALARGQQQPQRPSTMQPKSSSTADLTSSPTKISNRVSDESPSPANNFTGSAAAGSTWVDPLRVQMVRAHQNCIAAAYPHFVACFKQRENHGFQSAVERMAINAKIGSVGPLAGGGMMLAIAYSKTVRLMGFTEEGTRIDIGTFNLHAAVDHLFFIGAQLVALSPTGKIGVWNSMTQLWQTQELAAITSHDTAGSFLLLGSSNGSINYIDMQKFPLRMKDNDLLVTELYRDPAGDAVTAISVYLTPKTSIYGNWIEIAYGTSSGTVRVIVQHPETVGHGPQLFQTFSVHRSPVTKVKLSEKLLVSVCCEYNHVRTWGVTRFRGMISTQPGSTSVASFKIVSLEELEPISSCSAVGNECGPYGEQDDEQVFVQKVVPETDCLYVRLANDGRRVCIIKSVDGTTITSFCVHECEGSSGRIGARPRRFVITGHSSGAVQMWDLTTALELFHGSANDASAASDTKGGPTAQELVQLLHHLELSNSRISTPCCVSPAPSASSSVSRLRVALTSAQHSADEGAAD